MSGIKRAVLAAVLGSVVAACSTDSTGNGLPNVVGAWTITKFEFTSSANPATKTDLKAAGGSGTITFNSNNTWAVAFTLPGQGAFNSSGTYTETAATLTITVTSDTPPEIITFDMVVSGATLSLTGGSADFDFGAGDVPAHLTIIATK